jgi:uncharacterized UPF0146 family protein
VRKKGIAHLFLLVVVVVVAIGAIGYLAYQNAQFKMEVSDIDITTTTDSETPSSYTTVVEDITTTPPTTSDWKTYNNLSAKYSIQYPPNWNVLNFGLMEAEPADENTKYVRFGYQSDISKSEIGFDVKESNELDISKEIKLNEERDIGTDKAMCGSTGDGKTSFCWLKTPDGYNYLIFTISNYQKIEDNETVNQILSTFKFTE